jgi:hypothetical protein
MSEFVYLFRATAEGQRAATGTPEAAQRSLQSWLAWIRDLEARGKLKTPGQPLDAAGKVVRKDKVVTDGPFAEAKDIVLGFMVVQARDMEEAVELAGGCPMVIGGGSVEVRPVRKLDI